MRYVIAMIFAIVAAVFTAAQFAAPLTTSILDGMKFESPDQVEDLHTALLAGIAFLGLVAGWLIGWLVGGLFVRPDAPEKPDAPKS
jgi:hypothetical protein